MGITTKLANTVHLPAPENSVVSHEVQEHEADNRLFTPRVFTEKKTFSRWQNTEWGQQQAVVSVNLVSAWNTVQLAGTVNSIQNWAVWLLSKCHRGGAKCSPTVSLRKQRSPEHFSIHCKHSLILSNSVFASPINNSCCAKQSRKTKTVVPWVNITKIKLSCRQSPLKPTVPQCERIWSCCMASCHSSHRKAVSVGRRLPSISHSIRGTPEHFSIYRNWRFRFQMRIHLLGPGSTRGTQKLHRNLHLNFQEPSGHKGRLTHFPVSLPSPPISLQNSREEKPNRPPIGWESTESTLASCREVEAMWRYRKKSQWQGKANKGWPGMLLCVHTQVRGRRS